MWKVSRSPAPSSLPFVLSLCYCLSTWCTWRALIGNKSCTCWNVGVAMDNLAWYRYNYKSSVHGVAHKLKMAESLEEREKKSGSDLEFGVPDVKFNRAITNKVIDPFLHTYLSLSLHMLQLHLSRWTTYLMLWRMYGTGVLWVNAYIPITSHLLWMIYSDGMLLTRLALKLWLKAFSMVKVATSSRRGGR